MTDPDARSPWPERPWLPALVRGLMGLASALLCLGIVLELGLWRTTLSIDGSQIRPEEGFAYRARLRSPVPGLRLQGDSAYGRRGADTVLLEDGVPLGPNGALHDVIREQGEGRYSHWRRSLIFSTRDNSDPRTNGRHYAVTASYSLNGRVAVWAAVALVAGGLYLRRAGGSHRANRSDLWRRTTGALRMPSATGTVATASELAALGAGVVFGLAVLWALFAWDPTGALVSGANRLERGLVGMLAAAGLVLAGRWLWLAGEERGTWRTPPAPGAWWLLFVGVVLLTMLFGTPMLRAWRTGETTVSYVGGLLPYNDATGYYQGGLQLLYEGVLNTWNQRRPVNAALHALRLDLLGGNLQASIGLAALAASLAVFLAARELRRALGLAAAVIFLLLVYGWARTYLPTTLTAVHGLVLGALGFALFWRAATDRSVALFGLGMLALSLGLSARAGPFLLLPALLAWGLLYLGRERWPGWQAGLAGIAGAAGGVAVPLLYNGLWGESGGTAQANFAYTLYGMAAGGMGWQHIYTVHPELFTRPGAPEPEIYRLAFDLLRSDPLPFLRFYLHELQRFGDFARELVSLDAFGLPQVMTAGLWIGTAWCVYRVRDRTATLLLFTFLGTLLSAPFLIMDGGPRVFAVAIPFLGSLAASPVALGERIVRAAAGGDDGGSDPKDETRHGRHRPLGVIGALALVIAVAGPGVSVSTHERARAAEGACPPGETPMVIMPGEAATVLRILPDDALARTRVPDIRASDFHGAPALAQLELWPGLSVFRAPFAIVLAYNFVARQAGTHTMVWAVGWDEALRTAANGRLLLCGVPDPSPEMASWKQVFFRIQSARTLP